MEVPVMITASKWLLSECDKALLAYEKSKTKKNQKKLEELLGRVRAMKRDIIKVLED